MIKIKYFLPLFLSLIFPLSTVLSAQELNAEVSVVRGGAIVSDDQVLQEIEQLIRSFLNDRNWTEFPYESHERIDCNFQVNLEQEDQEGGWVFKGSLLVSSSRPVFGSDYKTRLMTHNDLNFSFVYEQGRPLQFSENVYQSNLSSLLSYYAYLIIAMDMDSFGLMAGEPFYTKALNFTNQARSEGHNSGWFAESSSRNRFWLIQNFTSSAYKKFRQGLYKYHREGMDLLSEDPVQARKNIIDALTIMESSYNNSPNQMVYQIFANAKAEEIVDVFKAAPTYTERNKVLRIMQKFDPSKARILKQLQ